VYNGIHFVSYAKLLLPLVYELITLESEK